MSVAILGGGVSGLALAHRLWELARENGGTPLEVSLYEESARFGGLIETGRRDGFLLESGPDSFLSEKTSVTSLARRIGLGDELLETRTSFRRSLIQRGGRLHPLPKGFQLIAPTRTLPFLASGLFSPAGKLRMLAERWVPRRKDAADESVASFIRRRFGQEALDRVGQPLVGGIYTGDPETLSADAALARFRRFESESGSVLKGLGRRSSAAESAGPRYGLFLSFKQGMQALTDRLASRLPAAWLKSRCEIRRVSFDAAKRLWRLTLSDGSLREARALVSTLPAPGAAKVLAEAAPGAARLLADIPHESVATVNLAYRRTAVGHRLNGFGFVVPREEGSPLVACTFVDRKFEGRAPEDGTLLRAFVGGAFGGEAYAMDDRDLVRAVAAELSRVLNLGGEPLFTSLRRHPESMVQYRVGHAARLNALGAELRSVPGLYLAGAWRRGVGIPDCVAEAETCAKTLFNSLTEKGIAP